MKSLPAIVVVAAIMGGCVNAREAADRRNEEGDRFCKSIGAQPGTPSYVDCRLRVEEQFQANRRAVIAGSGGGPVVCNRVGNTTICN
jgi:hypothetical protein